MLAERADEILGQLVALVDIAADLANKALLKHEAFHHKMQIKSILEIGNN